MVDERDLEAPRDEAVGEILARERAAQGLTLEDVAQQLKFGPRLLEALEQDRFDSLPGGTFARGMVRNYARLLRLDADALLARMEGKFDMPDSSRLADRYKQPVPFSNASRSSNVVYGILSLLILAVVAVVLIEWKQERTGTARLAFVPAAQAPVEARHPASASPSQSTASPSTKAASPAPAEKVASPVSPATPVATPPSAAPAPADEPAPAVVQTADEAVADKPALPAEADAEVHRIVMRFDDESWVEVRDATGRTLVGQLIPAGAQRVISGQPPFDVVIGNAQYVHVVYDNKPFDLKPHTRVDVARFTLK